MAGRKYTDLGIHQMYDHEVTKGQLPSKVYRQMLRLLNTKQKQIVQYHRKWCVEAVTNMRRRNPVVPYQIFLSGPGGVGKSH